MSPVSVRHIVNDVDAATEFYTQRLGFTVDMRPGPGFAMISRGDLRLLLSVPGGGGGAGQSMPDGQRPEPGGWNRVQIEVEDLASLVDMLKKDGVRFRSDVIVGNGGSQILVNDPSGNAIELFEPRPAT